MSSESKEHKPGPRDSSPPAAAERRPSVPAPSAWGAARDALAAIRNLEMLLRSTSVAHRTILDLLPELRASAGVLRQAFETAPGGDPATAAVSAYGGGRVDALVHVLDRAERPDEDREDLASRARSLGDELEASADLLALLDRAASPVTTEVSVGLVVRETSRMFGSASGRELVVRFDEAVDCIMTADPYIVGSLLLIAVGAVHAAGVDPVVVRASCSASKATVVVEAAAPADLARPPVALRVLPAVPPGELAALRVAGQIGAVLRVGARSWSMTMPLAPG